MMAQNTELANKYAMHFDVLTADMLNNTIEHYNNILAEAYPCGLTNGQKQVDILSS